jgi:putative Ca2+/H+ antiporter (TMEM165/GDT1 family)
VSRSTVFAGASLALIAASAIGVAAGAAIAQYLNPRYLHYIAGVGFIVIGAWTLCRA